MSLGPIKSFVQSNLFKNAHWLWALRHRRYWRRRNDFSSFEAYFNDFQKPNRLLILDLVKGVNPSTVYEYGCYSGPNLRLFSENINGKFYGSDVNANAVQFAKEHLPNMELLAASDSDIGKLEKWLPQKLDVVVVTSVFYVLKTTSVISLLRFFKSRSKYLVIGCHMGNFEGSTTEIQNEHFRHPWKDICEKLSLKVVKRIRSPYQDDSVTDYLLLTGKAIRDNVQPG